MQDWEIIPLKMQFRNSQAPLLVMRAQRRDVPWGPRLITIELSDEDIFYTDEEGRMYSTPLMDIVQMAAHRAYIAARAEHDKETSDVDE